MGGWNVSSEQLRGTKKEDLEREDSRQASCVHKELRKGLSQDLFLCLMGQSRTGQLQAQDMGCSLGKMLFPGEAL